jgi:cytochrome b561
MDPRSVITVAEIMILTTCALIAVWYFVRRRDGRRRVKSFDPAVSAAARVEAGTDVSKYHPAIVVMHWFVAFAMAQLLIRGPLLMVHIPNSDPAKIGALRAHMIAGILVLAAMTARFILRNTTSLPAPASPRNVHLNRLKKVVLPLLYICVFCQALAGLGMAIQAGLPEILFGGHGRLPADFWVYPLRSVHYVFSRLLMVLIALHVAGAAYHTLMLRDGLLRRMSFGRRTVAATGSSPATTPVGKQLESGQLGH